MAETSSHDQRNAHEAARELLPRFIEIERRDGNAHELYPQVAAHIDACDLCQFTLSVVMTDLPGFDAPPDSKLRAADLPFMRQPGKGTHTIRPGSGKDNYSIHIRFPLLPNVQVGAEVARSGPGSDLDIPVSGRSLGSYSLEIADGELGVTMTVYQAAIGAEEDSFYIIADLVGDMSPGAADAMLMVGSQIYRAPVIDQTVEFLDVELGDVPDQVVLILES